MSAPDHSAPDSEDRADRWLSAPGSNTVTDLVGNPATAALRLAMNGNQWMVLPELCELWVSAHPEYAPVFYETLPPGLVVQQARTGEVGIGELSLSIMPDAVAAGPDMLAGLLADGLIDDPVDYARNDLAVLVNGSGTEMVRSLADLGRDDVRIAMPNPRTEGVGRLIVRALEATGGSELADRVMVEKVADGTTLLTSIHHRESPTWLLEGRVDAAPLWSTEAALHSRAHPALHAVPIADDVNQCGRYCIAAVRGGRPVGSDIVAFMSTPQVRELYARHGFSPPV